MKWKGRRGSSNVQDARSKRVRAASGAGAGAILNLVGRSFGWKGILVLIVLGLIGWQMGLIDPSALTGGPGTGQVQEVEYQPTADEQELFQFVQVVLADTEDIGREIFLEQGITYQDPKLILFENGVNSACGMASSAVGPFYCPGDHQLYLDLSFFRDLGQRHGAPGDFAQAYVIAHEVGHHVQTLLGISDQVRQAKRGKSQAQANAFSVRQELQADCFAGLWGHAYNTERQRLDPGDLEEALTAATAIGDDRLQRESGRGVVPDSFTHGTSAQRVRWFRIGFETGDIAACDTFSKSID